MSDHLLARDLMRIGVLTCKPDVAVQTVAALMIDQNSTAVVVLDADGDSRGWINEHRLTAAFLRIAQSTGTVEAGQSLTAADIMEEDVPECPADLRLAAAVQFMLDKGADHLFFMHHAGGRMWPASQLSLRDLVRVLAGPSYVQGQGAGAPRPTPMDLFRQRYAKK